MIDPADPAKFHIDTIAFASASTIGEVGARLGILLPNPSSAPGAPPFVRNLSPPPPRFDGIALEMALVHSEFDAGLAETLSGRPPSGSRAAVLIGAGAIASMVCEPLVREGRVGPLTIVDDDTLLPHNLARHTLITADVGRSKARALAERLNNVRRDLGAEPKDVNALVDADGACSRACEGAHVVIDASASVPVARRLSDLGGASRRASVFFNPGGTVAVLLMEDEERKSDLRSLEAAYHRELQVNTSLADHMAVPGTLRYTGACRSLTSRMPASRAQALAGIVAQGLTGALDSATAVVRIWTMHEDGRVDVVTADTACERHERGGWTVVLPSSLAGWLAEQRADALPAETGGVVLGIIDLDAKRIDLVEALAAPLDSLGTPVDFVRGIQGLRPAIDAAVLRSLGQIRYLGEWHSHPHGAGALPSTTDIKQIAWLADTL